MVVDRGINILPFKKPTRKVDSISAVPMRRLVFRGCNTCGHQWVQPSLEGACPSCHDMDVVILDIGECVAPYRR